MSMTGRWIDQLNEQAAGGDAAAQETLRHAGLWRSPAEEADAEFEMFRDAAAGRLDLQFVQDLGTADRIERDEPETGALIADSDAPR